MTIHFSKYRLLYTVQILSISILFLILQGCSAPHTKSVQPPRPIAKGPAPMTASRDPLYPSGNHPYYRSPDFFPGPMQDVTYPPYDEMGREPFVQTSEDGHAMDGDPAPSTTDPAPPNASSSDLVQRLNRLKEDMAALKQRALALKGEQASADGNMSAPKNSPARPHLAPPANDKNIDDKNLDDLPAPDMPAP